MDRDFVDWVLNRWQEERPDLDVGSIAVVGRLLRIASVLERRFDRLCRDFGVSLWAFSLLTALRRSGPPYRLTPTQLQRDGMVSMAAITKQVELLLQARLVDRRRDPNDGRSVLIGLTRQGAALLDRVVPAYLESERDAIAALSPVEQAELAGLLRGLLLDLEGRPHAPASERAGDPSEPS